MDTEKRIEQLENELNELRSFANDARSSLDSLVSSLTERAQESYEEVKDNAEDVWDEAKKQSHSLWKKTRRGAQKAYDTTVDYTQEHPWRVTSSALLLIGLFGAVCYLVNERSNDRLESLKRNYRDYF